MKRRFEDFATSTPVNAHVLREHRLRCDAAYHSAHNQKVERPISCGLPAWERAGQSERRCLLHSRHKPDDLPARLRELIEAGASLAEARFEYADLSGLDLSEMDLEAVRFDGAKLRGANLRGCHISFAGFQGADLTGVCLAGAGGTHVSFNGALLRDADLRGLEVDESEFEGADLTGADLTDARLAGVNLRGCRPRPEAWVGPQWLVRSDSQIELPPEDESLRAIIKRGQRLIP